MEKIENQDVRNAREFHKHVTMAKKSVEWLKNNGMSFFQPIHKTITEIELEADRRFGHDNCSPEKTAFIHGAMWAANLV